MSGTASICFRGRPGLRLGASSAARILADGTRARALLRDVACSESCARLSLRRFFGGAGSRSGAACATVLDLEDSTFLAEVVAAAILRSMTGSRGRVTLAPILALILGSVGVLWPAGVVAIDTPCLIRGWTRKGQAT
jgi:hypothetical protein